MKKIFIFWIASMPIAFGQSVTISPNNPEHIKVVKTGTARMDLEGISVFGSSSGNSQINLKSVGTSNMFGSIEGEASINFLNTGNTTPIFSIKNTHQDFLFSSNSLKISAGANDFMFFNTTGSMSFPTSEIFFDNNKRVVFGPFSVLSNRTNFNVNSRVGNTHAIFGNDYAGVSIESDWPGIGLNGYYNGSRRPISNGYVGGLSLDPISGTIRIYNSATSGTAGSPISQFDRLIINNQGNVGIGIANPLASLDVARGTGSGGSAAFKGTQWYSHFNYSTNEDTYIRGGKDGANVLINDLGTLGNVGIGTTSPLSKLHVNGNIRSSSLAGSGNRQVYADANGTLITDPQTKTVIINPQQFIRRYNTGSGTLTSTNSYLGSIMVGAGATDQLVASFSIPEGATLLSFTIYYTDNDASNNLKFLVGKSSVTNAGFINDVTLFQNTENAFPYNISSISSASLNWSSDANTYFTILVEAVGLTQSSPGVWNYVGGSSNQMSIKGVKVTYTL